MKGWGRFLPTVIGFGLVLAVSPFAGVFQLPIALLDDAPSELILLYAPHVLYAAGFLLACPLLLLLSSRATAKVSHVGSRRMLLLVSVSCSLLVALTHLAFVASGALWLVLLLAFLAGCFAVVLWIQWGECMAFAYAREEKYVITSMALLLAAVVNVAYYQIGQHFVEVNTLLSAAFPFVSYLCIDNAYRHGEIRLQPDDSTNFRVQLKLPWVSVLLFSFSGFAYGSFYVFAPSDGDLRGSIALAFFTVALFVAVVVYAGERGRATSLAQYARAACLLCIIAGTASIVMESVPRAIISYGLALGYFAQVTLFLAALFDSSSASHTSFFQAWLVYSRPFLAGFVAAVFIFAMHYLLTGGHQPRLAAALFIIGPALLLALLPNYRNNTENFLTGDFVENRANVPAANLDDRIADFGRQFGLTPREAEMTRGLYIGLSYRMISAELSISEQTVKTHIRNLYAKCGVHSRGELINLLMK